MEAKLFQHEVDHLDGRLLLDVLDQDQRKKAMKELRRRTESGRDQASTARR
jgi:peptide deformylase